MKQIIMGVDPGTIQTGVAIITWNGERCRLKSLQVLSGGRSSTSLSQRLLTIGQGLEALYRQYSPQETAIEKVFFGKNADSAFKIGHVVGICTYMAACYHSKVFYYASRLVKQSVTGSGSADKEVVKNFVLNAIGQSEMDIPVDATDALGVALCHTIHKQTSLLLNKD